MPLGITAFDLSPAEKHAVIGQIRSLVLGAGALIARAKKHRNPSPHDFIEALDLVNRALVLATDEDACDPSLAPLATCFLYKGHIHLALGNFQEAHAAYTEAASSSERRRFTDTETSRDEARRLLNNWDDTMKSAQRDSGYESEAGGPGERFVHTAGHGIVLSGTIRPGPGKRPVFKTVPKDHDK
ncbi:hypothetical protein F5B22DRAFT_658734 [Xylaria bambusicola]|uniref:uncharacterized protein n=1 Tax=Xylaria bambusicola TaxID=326684 RepID=UPI0020079A00|nr:uncharacterized protein F5B22DRAFT_658734 [Xylaria bambusicola]KAI0508943.1 hypothetical protein F5B22DRAFT_658734 [Xylaria bambusicola]